MGFSDRPGLWVGESAELGDRLLGLPEAPVTGGRSHLVAPPQPSVAPFLEFHTLQHRVDTLEIQVLTLDARLAALEGPPRWWVGVRGWWRRVVTRLRREG